MGVNDVEELKEEFMQKIVQICGRTGAERNFLLSMFRGDVEISAFPPFNRPEYHDAVSHVRAILGELPSVHTGGLAFLRDLKLLLSQIAVQDWAPIDSKRALLRLSLLRKHMADAIAFGCLPSGSGGLEQLTSFDTGDAIADDGGEDSGLVLAVVRPPADGAAHAAVCSATDPELAAAFPQLLLALRAAHARTSERSDGFDAFLSAALDRRCQRVEKWVSENVAAFSGDADVQRLGCELAAQLAGLKQCWTLCGLGCDLCFLRCSLIKGHAGGSGHSCMTSHACEQRCTFCAEPDRGGAQPADRPCGEKAGHAGEHDCGTMGHTCGKDCAQAAYVGCAVACVEPIGHSGPHRCKSLLHCCGQPCALPGCPNTCALPVAVEHDRHACFERLCPAMCCMPGCGRMCSSGDHFHSPQSGDHFCAAEHACGEECEEVGICEVKTELKKTRGVFNGARGFFEFDFTTEQNGRRLKCAVIIPAGQRAHAGTHRHSLSAAVAHYCDARCGGCSYFCSKPHGHTGLHATTHGNMIDRTFAGEHREIDVADRKYVWGERGTAEMCPLFCRVQGRGHIHLALCGAGAGGVCAGSAAPRSARHETKRYGPDVDVPKDEIKHAAYWAGMGFEDPCSSTDQSEFGLCGHYCGSRSHAAAPAGAGGAAGPSRQGEQIERSYCSLPLWHDAAAASAGVGSGHHASADGHLFSCSHPTAGQYHTVFIIDRSGSMASQDARPTLTAIAHQNNNRLGCVYEAIVRFCRVRRAAGARDVVSVVLFNHAASIVLRWATIASDEQLLGTLGAHGPDGGTSFRAGLSAAATLLGGQSGSTSTARPTAIVFLSDGEGGAGSAEARAIRAAHPNVTISTIKFGTSGDNAVLEQLAREGGGRFHMTVDELQLASTFEAIAESLKDKTAALI